VEYEARWAGLAARNIGLAASQGARGTGEIYQSDSGTCPRCCRPSCTVGSRWSSPRRPTGHPPTAARSHPESAEARSERSTTSTARTPGNLAYRDHDELADGFTQILTGVAAILRPGGIVAITARPYRRHGELIDIPGMVVACWHQRRPAPARGMRRADRWHPQRTAGHPRLVLPAEERAHGDC